MQARALPEAASTPTGRGRCPILSTLNSSDGTTANALHALKLQTRIFSKSCHGPSAAEHPSFQTLSRPYFYALLVSARYKYELHYAVCPHHRSQRYSKGHDL